MLMSGIAGNALPVNELLLGHRQKNKFEQYRSSSTENKLLEEKDENL
jgi:hypothetical protein